MKNNGIINEKEIIDYINKNCFLKHERKHEIIFKRNIY